MTPELSRRLAHAMTKGCATPAERQQLNRAAAHHDVRSVSDLPAEAQSLLTTLETRDSALSRAASRLAI